VLSVTAAPPHDKPVATAAGSPIPDEVPADSLAIARERQVNKPGWAEQWRAAHEKK